ncbi:uncharacterized protein LOC142819623 isoform X2 [Pelodiscus sinensis]
MFPGLAEKLNFRKMTKVLSCLSLLTELLALVSPYWLEISSHGFETTIGLWNICLNWFCRKLPTGSVTFEVVKALMTLSTLLGFIAVCSVFISFHSFHKYRLAAITNSLTGLCTLASVLTFRVSFTKISEPFHPEMKPQRGWSFYVGCLAGFLFLASALLSLITYIQCPNTPLHSRSQVSPQQDRPQRPVTLQQPPPSAQPQLPPPE